MKKIFILIMTLFSIHAYAGIYKCNVKGKISYQQSPCVASGAIGYEIKQENDISLQQQAEAKEKMAAELAVYNETKKLKKEAYDKERLIRAEEDKAYAALQRAQQAKRQVNALEQRNEMRIRQRSSYYYTGRYPLFWSPWMYRHHHKRPHFRNHLYTIELGQNRTHLYNKTGALKKWQ